MRNQLNSRVMLSIQANPWMEHNALNALKLFECTKPHQLIERVLINVAARVGKGWKEIYNAPPTKHDLFCELCVAAILIDRGLKEHLHLHEEDVLVIMRARLSQIVETYYQNLRAKR